MRFKQIEAFLKVVEKGSFSEAAEELFITQPTISVRIQQLEQDLHARLFERVDGKKIKLTKTGQDILPYYREAFELIQKAHGHVQQTVKIKNKVVISCPSDMGVEVLPELLNVLYKCYPHTEFEIKISSTEQILEDHQNGRIDIGIVYAQAKKKQKSMNMVKIADGKIILVCSPNSTLAKMDLVKTENLRDEKIFIYQKELFTAGLIHQFLREESADAFKSVEINNIGWIKMMVRKELGIAFLQKMMVYDEIMNHMLVELKMDIEFPKIPISLIFDPFINEDLKKTTISAAKMLFNKYT